jgi:outer membrane protein assembly factor BamB
MYRTDAHEDRSLLLLGHNRAVWAYRRETGELAWKYENDHAYDYYVDFVVVGKHVFVAVNEYIVRLDYATGRPINSTQCQSRVLRVMHDDGMLYAFGDENIYCVDLDGRIIWVRNHKLYTASTMPTFGFPGNIINGFRDSG